MDSFLIALVVAVVIISGLLILFIHFSSRRYPALNRSFYQAKWSEILTSVNIDNLESMQMAVLKADKLVDNALRQRGVAGQTMGDRLKAKRGDWTHENVLWAAHKLRNQIAHETQVKLDQQTFKRAMAGFESALKDLGAL